MDELIYQCNKKYCHYKGMDPYKCCNNPSYIDEESNTNIAAFIFIYTYFEKFTSFEFHPGILGMIEAYLDKEVMSIHYIPRMKFKTTTLVSLYVYTKVYKPDVNAILIGRNDNDEASLKNKAENMIKYLPDFDREKIKENDKYDKTKRYLFINDFEFLPWTREQYLDLISYDNNKIIACSTINDDLDPYIADLIDTFGLCKNVYKTSPDIFGDEYKYLNMEYSKHDKDAFRREILLERKSK